jgi:hypothetical protein
MTSTTTTTFKFSNGTVKATGFDKVRSQLSAKDLPKTTRIAVSEVDDVIKSSGKARTTYTYTVSSKGTMTAEEAIKHMAGKSGNLSILSYAPNSATALTRDNLLSVAESIIAMYAVKFDGSEESRKSKAREELATFLAGAAGEKKSQEFSTKVLTDIAKILYEVDKVSDVTVNQRLNTLEKIKTSKADAKRATAAAGYDFETIRNGASTHFFVRSKVDKNGVIEDRFSLRSSQKVPLSPPTYKDDGSNVQMNLSPDRLFFIDPRDPEPKEEKDETGNIVVRKPRGNVERGEDKEYQGAYEYLRDRKNYSTTILDALAHSLVKTTARDTGFKFGEKSEE